MSSAAERLKADATAAARPGSRPLWHMETDKGASEEKLPSWDDNPVTYLFGGQAREFFLIGHLAEALGRKPVTLRSWENRGILPKTPYRTPKPRGSGSLQGKESKGRRLWTRDQVQGILQIAKEEGVILDGGPPPSPRFTARVYQLFQALYQQETTSNST